MKGRKIIRRAILALAAVALLCAACFLAVACSDGNAVLEDRYYAYYGERFLLPAADGEYYVTDAEGRQVDIVLGGFTVQSEGDYNISLNRGGKKESSVLKVLQRDVINFISDRKLTFASLNNPVQLPQYTAVRNGEQIPVETVLLSPSGEELGRNLPSFTPDKTGNYILRAQAEGQTDESVIEVGESASYKNLLAPMDRKEAEDMFVRRFGFSMSLNTEDSRYFYGAQKASMKVISNMEANVSGGFQMTGFAEPDISDTNGFYFYVYNAGTVEITMDINWMTGFTLKSHAWTRISVNGYNELCAQSGNAVIAEHYSDKNLNGILFNFYYAQGGSWQGMPALELYFSNFYTLPDLVPSELNAYIDELPAQEEVGKEDAETVSLQIEELETMYYSMSEYQRALVDFSKLAQLKMHLLRLENTDAPEEEDVIVYFNSSLGIAQADIYLNPSDRLNTELTQERAYGDEGASTHVWYADVQEGGERWDLDIEVHTPAITDLSFGYDTYYMYVYNDSDSDVLYYAWPDDSAGWVQPLLKGQWNLICLTDFSTMSGADSGATRFNITNFRVAFAVNPWNANSGASFYFSNIRALSSRTVEERLNTQKNDAQYLSETVALYEILSDSSKRNIENYDGLLADMFNRTAQRMVSDLQDADTDRLSAVRTEIGLLDEIYKFASKAAKSQVESSYRALAPAYINSFVALYRADSAEQSLLQDLLYVYGTMNAQSRAGVNAQAFEEFYGSLLTRYGLNGQNAVAAFSEPEGAVQAQFRIQSDTGVLDEDWNKIFDYNETYPEFVYTTERSHASDSGSTRLTVPVTSGWDVLKMYLTLPSAFDLSDAQYDTLYFYVYNASSVDYTLEVYYTRTFTLTKNAWTKVYIDDWSAINGEGTREDIRGLCFDIHHDWNLQTPAVLYFSSVLPANADTVNELIANMDQVNPDPAMLAEIRSVYEMLSDEQKALASAYRGVALSIMQDLCEEFGAQMTEQQKLEIVQVYGEILPSSQEDELELWYQNFYNDCVKGVADPDDPKVFYYGYAYGADQVSVRFDDAYGTYSDVIFPKTQLTDQGVYDEEVSLRITSDATTKTWASVYMTLHSPYLTTIDGEGIYAYVYNNMSHDVYGLFWPNRFTFKAKSWNLLYLDRDSIEWANSALQDKVDLNNFDGFTLELFYYNSSGTTQLYDGLDILITPFKQATSQQIGKAMDFYTAGTGSEADRAIAADCAVTMYAAASEQTKTLLQSKYALFGKACLAQLDSAYGLGGDKIIGFDSAAGAKQVYVSVEGKLGTNVAFTESPVFSAERAYGTEAGSTRFKQGQFTTDTQNVWYIIRLIVGDLSSYGRVRFAVYNESTNDYRISLGTQSVALSSNQWTVVEFDLSQSENILEFKVECGNKIGRDALWFSAVYGI